LNGVDVLKKLPVLTGVDLFYGSLGGAAAALVCAMQLMWLQL
jgi:hypothetical protein